MRKKLWRYLVSYILLICITAGFSPIMVSSAQGVYGGGSIKISVSEILKTLTVTGGEGKNYDLEALPEDVISELEGSVIVKKGSVNGLNYYITAEIMDDLNESDPASCLQGLSVVLINQKNKQAQFPEIRIVDDDTYSFTVPQEAEDIWEENEEDIREENEEEVVEDINEDITASPSLAGKRKERIAAHERDATPASADKTDRMDEAHEHTATPASADKVNGKAAAHEQTALLTGAEKAEDQGTASEHTASPASAMKEGQTASPSTSGKAKLQSLASTASDVPDDQEEPSRMIPPRSARRLLLPLVNDLSSTLNIYVKDSFTQPIPNVSIAIDNLSFGLQWRGFTETDGGIKFNGLLYGDYRLTLSDLPDGYVLPPARQVTVASDTMTIVYQISKLNKSVYGTYDIGTYDIGGNEYDSPYNKVKLPVYVLKGGTWTQNDSGQWFYYNGRTFTDEWAAIWNSHTYTGNGQPLFYWYHFGKDSAMTTGWYTDEGGNTYFLHNDSDSMSGYMYTGWHWIDEDGDGISECYYFEPNSNGFRGRLYQSAVTPDGYTVDGNGQWIQDGKAAAKIIDR